MKELTKRQNEILTYIKKYMVSHGYPPTIREIGADLGVSSPATIHAHLANLESKGFIKKEDTKNRAIELLVENEYAIKDEEVVSVPLLGKITAGSPIEAIERPDEYFSLPAYLIPNNKEVFTLLVSGTSMINAGILSGDYVIVEQTPSAENGEQVVALIEDGATVKTFYREEGIIRLQPENDAYDPIILTDVTILGKVIGVIRMY